MTQKDQSSNDYVVIGSGSKIDGNIENNAIVDIFGVFKGSIVCKCCYLQEGSEINGEIKCEEMIVNGNFTGNISTNLCNFGSKAVFHGDLIYEKLICEDGAIIIGTLKNKDKNNS